jgi:hypothetical protein
MLEKEKKKKRKKKGRFRSMINICFQTRSGGDFLVLNGIGCNI